MLEIERAMKKEEASICLIQETKLPYSTERRMNDITFIVSSTISTTPERREHGTNRDEEGAEAKWNSKQEHHGVAIAVSNEWIKYLDNYTTLNSRMMRIMFNTRPFKLTIISAYAPHAQLSQQVKDKFYDHLTNLVEGHSRSSLTIVAGDFNAKLHDRIEGEENTIGENIKCRRKGG